MTSEAIVRMTWQGAVVIALLVAIVMLPRFAPSDYAAAFGQGALAPSLLWAIQSMFPKR